MLVGTPHHPDLRGGAAHPRLALPIVCGLFLLYGLFGHPARHLARVYGLDQIVGQLGSAPKVSTASRRWSRRPTSSSSSCSAPSSNKPA
jgi:hypothetical protein